MTETYRGVPVVERETLGRLDIGKYESGIIFVKFGLAPAKRAAVLRHEFMHHEFYQKFPILENGLFHTGCFALFLISFFTLPVRFLYFSLLPLFPQAVIWMHEISCYATDGDVWRLKSIGLLALRASALPLLFEIIIWTWLLWS